MNLKRDSVRLRDVFTTFPSPLFNQSISDGELPSSSSQSINILLVFFTGHLTRWYSEIKLGWAMESKRKRDRKRDRVRVSDNLTSFPPPLFNQLISEFLFPPLFNWSMSCWWFEWPAGGVVKWGESGVSNVDPDERDIERGMMWRAWEKESARQLFTHNLPSSSFGWTDWLEIMSVIR